MLTHELKNEGTSRSIAYLPKMIYSSTLYSFYKVEKIKEQDKMPPLKTTIDSIDLLQTCITQPLLNWFAMVKEFNSMGHTASSDIIRQYSTGWGNKFSYLKDFWKSKENDENIWKKSCFKVCHIFNSSFV